MSRNELGPGLRSQHRDKKRCLPYHTGKQKMLKPSSHQPRQSPPTLHPEGIQDEEKQDPGPR